MTNTTERLLEKYNSYRRRKTVEDQKDRRIIFTSLERSLGDWLPKEKGCAILDIACGEGSLLLFLQEKGYSDLNGFDFSPENVEICHRLGLDFVQLNNAFFVDELYGEKKFDVIFLFDFLEHVQKERAADFLEKLRKKLNPGGQLIIQTPNMGSLVGLYHRYNDLSHEFALTEKTAIDLLMIAGFSVDKIEIKPSWNAATFKGRIREFYMRMLHKVIFFSEDSSRPTIPTKNLLLRGYSK